MDSLPSELRSFIKPLTNIQIMMAHAPVATSKSRVDLDSNIDTCEVHDNCLVIHDHNRQVMSTVMFQKMTTEVQRQ